MRGAAAGTLDGIPTQGRAGREPSSATQSIAKYRRELGGAAKPAAIGAAPPRPSRTANEA
jgi:hypothetical protein